MQYLLVTLPEEGATHNFFLNYLGSEVVTPCPYFSSINYTHKHIANFLEYICYRHNLRLKRLFGSPTFFG